MLASQKSDLDWFLKVFARWTDVLSSASYVRKRGSLCLRSGLASPLNTEMAQNTRWHEIAGPGSILWILYWNDWWFLPWNHHFTGKTRRHHPEFQMQRELLRVQKANKKIREAIKWIEETGGGKSDRWQPFFFQAAKLGLFVWLLFFWLIPVNPSQKFGDFLGGGNVFFFFAVGGGFFQGDGDFFLCLEVLGSTWWQGGVGSSRSKICHRKLYKW